jgi:hypothetical protein
MEFSLVFLSFVMILRYRILDTRNIYETLNYEFLTILDFIKLVTAISHKPLLNRTMTRLSLDNSVWERAEQKNRSSITV